MPSEATPDTPTGTTPWRAMLGADPLPWLLGSDEPAARWIALTGILDRDNDDPQAIDVHRAVVADAGPPGADREIPVVRRGAGLRRTRVGSTAV